MKIVYIDLTKFLKFLIIAIFMLLNICCQATIPPITIKRLGNDQSMVYIKQEKQYLLLPVEESMPEARVDMIVDNQLVNGMNVRLAREKVEIGRAHV